MMKHANGLPRINSYRRRILRLLRPVLTPHAPFRRALDFGSGDGLFARVFREERLVDEVTPVDVQSRKTLYIEPLLYDGQRLPFPNRSFDLTYAMDVLHHCSHPRSSLEELARCSSKWVLLKDHTHQAPLGRRALCALDDVGNRRFGVPCLNHYQRGWEWFPWLEAQGFVLEQLVHPAACHGRPLGRFLNRLEFIALFRRANGRADAEGRET